MGFRISKEKERQNQEPTPLEKKLGAPVLNFGLAPGTSRARWIRKPIAPAEDPAAVKDDASSQS